MTFNHSLAGLVRHALTGHRHWPQAWRSPEARSTYDVIVIGAGGHGLATAYYLAKNHGIRRVAVLEKGWLGGGNTGRNTTNIRSNYLYAQSQAFYEFSRQLYEGLSRELDYNVMFSPRGYVTLAHSHHDVDRLRILGNSLAAHGVEARWLDRDALAARAPYLDLSRTARHRVVGGLLQPRAGTARHDAVAWGYARAADALGVDIIQQCEVTGFLRRGARVSGVATTNGEIHADRVALCVAGHSSSLANLAGLRLPVTSYCLQAMVSEPLKPVLDLVVQSPATGVYVNQSDKGELVFGAGLDHYPSYAQRGNFPTIAATVSACLALFPGFSRVRMLRHWGGIVDVVHDSSPIIGRTPIEGLFLNCGFGTGGFKAIPAGGYTLAHTIATGEVHALVRPFALERFQTGALLNETAASSISH